MIKYKIDDPNYYTYIGSTTKELNIRLSEHKCKAKRGATSTVYKYMREHYIFNFEIVLLKKYPCNNKEELLAKEQEYINLYKPKLNDNNAVRQISQKDYLAKYQRENIYGVSTKCIYCDKMRSKKHMKEHEKGCIKRCWKIIK